MRYRNIIIALGILIVLVQFLGFPQSWDNAIYAVAALCIIALAYVGERR
ncbi:MAG TPA: hypothetical protein VFQ72_04075 [Candidatus Paceibacterota bacterium]|nr:hypothetical protein [Candidatus Paceibacterota bacterium]